MLQNWYTRFSAQPHQAFFSNGIMMFILFMGLLYAAYSNFIVLNSTLITFHAYAFIFVIFAQFFLGFLFVVFPRFLMQANIEPSVYMQQFWQYFLGGVLFFVGVLFFKPLFIAGMLLIFFTQLRSFITLYLKYKKSTMNDKYDTKWVLIGFVSGLVAHALYLISLFQIPYAQLFEKLAINMGFYLFLFVIIFAISQRMVPFFTSMKVPGYTINKSKNLMEKIYFFLGLKVILITFANTSFQLIADIPLLIIFTYELYKWRLPLFKVSAIMWVLFISLYWIPLGFLISSVESVATLLQYDWVFEKASLHIFAVGYFLTILIGFGTRVVLGHSGQTPHADKMTIAIFLFVQVVVLARLLASFSLNFGMDYIFWINHSALLLIIGLMLWSLKYLKILIKGHTPLG